MPVAMNCFAFSCAASIIALTLSKSGVRGSPRFGARRSSSPVLYQGDGQVVIDVRVDPAKAN